MSPTEIEDVIYTHPAVKSVCVVPVEDDSAGEVPLAYIVLKDQQNVTEEEIAMLVKGQFSFVCFRLMRLNVAVTA